MVCVISLDDRKRSHQEGLEQDRDYAIEMEAEFLFNREFKPFIPDHFHEGFGEIPEPYLQMMCNLAEENKPTALGEMIIQFLKAYWYRQATLRAEKIIGV